MEMDYSKYLNKPFFVGSFDWKGPTVNPRYSTIKRIQIPEDVYKYNKFLAAPFKQSCYFRARARAHLQVSGTVNHGGVAIAYAQPSHAPSMVSTMHANTALASPHVFLYPNQANPVTLELPFFINTVAKPTAEPGTLLVNGDFDPTPAVESFCQLEIGVLSPLVFSTGAKDTVAITVHIEFLDMEFYVPCLVEPTYTKLQTQSFSGAATRAIDGVFSLGKKFTADIFDAGRGAIRRYTGLHNPNIAAPTSKGYVQSRNNPNVVDTAVAYDKLDPFSDHQRLSDQYYFKTTVDEMDVQHILSKPQLIGRFTVKDDSATGKFLFSRPIHPFQELGTSFSSLQAKLSMLSLAWSGDMEIIIQSSMTNFQFVKLLVVKDYSKTFKRDEYPDMASQTALPSDTLEFAGGGCTQVVSLPFQSQFAQLPITTNWDNTAFQHGVYRIYLMQPMVVSNNAPTTAEFLVYLRCKPNFKVYGYAPRHFLEPTVTRLDTQSGEIDVLTTQDPLLNDKEETKQVRDVDMRPIVSVRDWARRLCPVGTLYLDPQPETDGVFAARIDLADVLGTSSNYSDLELEPAGTLHPLRVLRKLFNGMRGGLKFKLRAYGVASIQATYVPPIPGVHVPVGKEAQWAACVPWETDADEAAGLFAPITGWNNVNPGVRFPLPQIEGPNYHSPNGGQSVAQGEALFSTHILEGEIPYMSALDFVGSPGVVSPSDPNHPRYVDSLGYLIVTWKPQYRVDLSSIEQRVTPSVAVCDVFMGLDDTARLGMQVYSSPISFFHYSPSASIVDPFRTLDDVGRPIDPSVTAPAIWYQFTV
nr:MAG: capsid protein [Picornaviridae sp.]